MTVLVEADAVKEKVGLSAIIYAIYCAILPLNMALNFTGFTINRYVGIAFVVCCTIDIMLKKKWVLKLDYLVFFVFLAWATVSIAWSINQEQTFGQLKTLINLVVLSVLALMRGFSEKEKNVIKLFMVVPATIVFFYLAPNSSVSVSRATIQTAAGSADHNGLAANLLFPLLIAVDTVRFAKKKYIRICCSICSILLFLSLLLIASRGAVAALIVGFSVYVILELKRVQNGYNLKNAVKWVILISAVIIGLFYAFQKIALPALGRLTISAISADSGAGRFNIWRSIWGALWNNNPIRLLVGYGYGTEGAISEKFMGVKVGIHNVYLELWATIGIIGLILLLVIFYNIIRTARNRGDSLSIALMVTLIVVCIPLGFLQNKGAWNVMVISLLGFNYISKNKTNENKTEMKRYNDDYY